MQVCVSRTFPTELAPKSTVKHGSSSSVRPTACSSAGRGKKPGRHENVCDGRSCARSLFSSISRRASSSMRRDSVSERRVSAGWK